MRFETVTPSIWSLNLGICNCFLLRSTSGYVLVDTGLQKHGDKILEALKQAGIAASGVKYILLTHAHKDHAGSAAQLKAVTGATVIAHALDAEIIQSGVHQRPMTPAPGVLNLILFQLFVKDLLPVPPVRVDRCVEDGETLRELDGLRVIHTPGHSAGQIAFLWPQDGGLLFVGDAAANTLGLRLSISYEDLQLGKRTLAKLAKLPFSKACFGHGNTISSGASVKFIRHWGVDEPLLMTGQDERANGLGKVEYFEGLSADDFVDQTTQPSNGNWKKQRLESRRRYPEHEGRK
ncbi:MAG TPA: MBL fold metallo-hydrolase [Bryobacteraceae bacterium]|nr:MBL fold metallo-hydrolase [Bryobacteraceae bacterium]